MAVIKPQAFISLAHEDKLKEKKKTKINGRCSVFGTHSECSNIVGCPVFHFNPDILVMKPSKKYNSAVCKFRKHIGF